MTLTLITKVELDLIGWHVPRLLSRCAISSGYNYRAIWEKIARFSMGVNVWQPYKYVISVKIDME